MGVKLDGSRWGQPAALRSWTRAALSAGRIAPTGAGGDDDEPVVVDTVGGQGFLEARESRLVLHFVGRRPCLQLGVSHSLEFRDGGGHSFPDCEPAHVAPLGVVCVALVFCETGSVFLVLLASVRPYW